MRTRWTNGTLVPLYRTRVPFVRLQCSEGFALITEADPGV